MNKNIILTGASSGIGEAAARLLAAQGHRLCLVARSDEKLKQLALECGNGAIYFTGDVRDYGSMTQMAEYAQKQMGKIDVLINNAGMGIFDPVIKGRIEDWHEMIDINVKGVLNVLHATLPMLIEARGHVVNMGSIASHHVFANSGVYSATKHAVFAISESLRVELPDKLRVTTISPGSVNTPFVEKTHNQDLLKDYRPYFAAGMSAELIAENIAFAVNTPENAVVSEIIIRPNRQVK